jgi:hypothetical protein
LTEHRVSQKIPPLISADGSNRTSLATALFLLKQKIVRKEKLPPVLMRSLVANGLSSCS